MCRANAMNHELGIYASHMTSFMREQAQSLKLLELHRCNQLAAQTRKLVAVSHITAMRCWGVDVDDPSLDSEHLHICVATKSARPHIRGVRAHV